MITGEDVKGCGKDEMSGQFFLKHFMTLKVMIVQQVDTEVHEVQCHNSKIKNI